MEWNTTQIGALAAVVLIFVLAIMGGQVVFPVRILLFYWSAFAWLVVIIGAIAAQGFPVIQKVGLNDGEDGGFRTALALGLGLGMICLETFVLGILGVLGKRSLTVLVLTSSGLGVYAYRKRLRGVFESVVRGVREISGDAVLPCALAVAGAVWVLPFVLVPTRDFDALTYHLEVPARYLQAGKIIPLPGNIPSNYPLLSEMAYTLGLGLNGTDLAGLLCHFFFVMTLLLIFAWARRRFGDGGAAWGVALLVSTPSFLIDTTRTGSDWPAAYYTLAAVLLLAGGDRRPGTMCLAGVMAGMAAGSKYPALGFAVILPLLVGVVHDIFRGRKTGILNWGLFALLSAVVALPWYIKNLIFTGDPFFPLLTGVFNQSAAAGVLAADTHFHRPEISDLWGWLVVPVAAIFDPERYQLSSTIGFLPLALIPLLPALQGRGTGSRFLGWWSALAFAGWYMTFRVGRFALPVYSLGVLWLGAALAYTLSSLTRFRVVLSGSVAAAMVVNMGVLIGVQAAVNRSVPAAFGVSSPVGYLQRHYDVFPSIEFLNRLNPPPSRVLFLGETRGFYSDFPREIPTFDSPNRLIEMMRSGLSIEEIARRLLEAGFSHILHNPREMSRLAEKTPYMRLNASERATLRNFINRRTRILFSANGIAVTEIIRE
jgi:hypothetical protein